MKKRFEFNALSFVPHGYGGSGTFNMEIYSTGMTASEKEDLIEAIRSGVRFTIEWDSDSTRIKQLRSQIESYNANILKETSRVNEGHERICRIQQDVRTLERELADLERQS